jgi:hypothetical protein
MSSSNNIVEVIDNTTEEFNRQIDEHQASGDVNFFIELLEEFSKKTSQELTPYLTKTQYLFNTLVVGGFFGKDNTGKQNQNVDRYLKSAASYFCGMEHLTEADKEMHISNGKAFIEMTRAAYEGRS